MSKSELTQRETRALMLRAAVPADRHPAAVYLARLALGSRRTMRGALDEIARTVTGGAVDAEGFAWGALRYQHTAAIRTALAERYAPATANKMLAALRGVLREAWRLGYVDADEHARAADLPAVKGSTLPSGRALSMGELRALFAACATSGGPQGARDAAVLAVLYAAGLRRSEVVALDLADYDPATGALTVRSGKGRKARVAYASNGSRDALVAWLELRGTDEGPLFLPVRKGGEIRRQRLSDNAVLRALKRLGGRAKVKDFSPHDLRRSFISHLLDAGADIVTVQHLAGHANVQTTARYDRRGEAAKRKASEMLHVPY